MDFFIGEHLLKLEKCPSTGLPIRTSKEWIDIPFNNSYTMSMAMIGENIFLVIPKGSVRQDEEVLRNIFDTKLNFFKHFGIKKRDYIELQCGIGIEDIPSMKVQKVYSSLLKEEQEKCGLVGTIGFNAPFFIRNMYNYGSKISSFSRIEINHFGSYKSAISEAIKLLIKRNINPLINSIVIKEKDHWSIDIGHYQAEIKLINNDILLNVARGCGDKEALKRLFSLVDVVLTENGFDKERPYYLISDWSELKRTKIEVSRIYYSGIRALNRKFPCRHRFIYGANGAMKTMINAVRKITPFSFSFVNNFEEAVSAVEIHRINMREQPGLFARLLKKLPASRINIYSKELIYWISSVRWGDKGIEKSKISKNHPFAEVFDAISTIKHDFDLTIQEKRGVLAELQESEAELRLLADSTVDMIFVMSATGHVIYTTPSSKELLGYNAEEMLGTHISKYAPDGILPIFVTKLAQIFETGSLAPFETHILHADGSKIPIEVNGRCAKRKGIDVAIGTVRDITERKVAEETRIEMQKQLFQSSKLASIGELATGVAHEINNPLTILKMYMETLEDHLIDLGTLDRSSARYLNKQKKSIDRIVDIISNLKLHARSSGENFVIFNVDDTIDDTLDLVRSIYYTSNITITKRCLPTMPLTYGNIGKFQQVIMNMLSNAKDAMKENERGTIDILISSEGQNLNINISDTGKGIPEKSRERIFDAFFTTKAPGEGTGLGLSIGHTIIQEMKGNISVSTAIGKGSTFTISIPNTPPLDKLIQREMDSHKAETTTNAGKTINH